MGDARLVRDLIPSRIQEIRNQSSLAIEPDLDLLRRVFMEMMHGVDDSDMSVDDVTASIYSAVQDESEVSDSMMKLRKKYKDDDSDALPKAMMRMLKTLLFDDLDDTSEMPDAHKLRNGLRKF